MKIDDQPRVKKFDEYIFKKYNNPAVKIPIYLNVDCPNRDGTINHEGCTFCSKFGDGHEFGLSMKSISQQVKSGIDCIDKNLNIIIYFPTYTYTYFKFSELSRYVMESIEASNGRAIEVCISTRPDCIRRSYALMLSKLCEELGVGLSFEIGLMSCNYQTLKETNRGHGVSDFISCALMLNELRIRYCARITIGYPWEDISDSIENAKLLSILKVPEVKIQSFYVLKDTDISALYQEGHIIPIEIDEYIERVIEFIRHASPSIIFKTFLGTAPDNEHLFCNWGVDWMDIETMVYKKLTDINGYQGDKFDYLDGVGIKHL